MTRCCLPSHSAVAAAQQILAELVEGDPGAAAQQTLAELVEGVHAEGGGVRLSYPC